MGRILGIFLLFAALAAAALAQNPTSTVVITTTPVPIPTPAISQPVSGALPVPAPPEAALPGSGTPVGTPPQLGVNDARTGGTGAIIQPGVGDVQIGGQQLLPVPVQVATPQATPDNTAQANQPIEYVPSEGAEASKAPTVPTTPTNTQAFRTPLPLSGSAGPGTKKMSLGEFAAQLKTRKPLTKRTFDNNDIAALNRQAPNALRPASEDLPQGDQPVQTAPAQKDKPRVLDQHDLRKVQDALERSKKKQDQSNPK